MPSLVSVLGVCFLAQFIGLFILTRERQYWVYIQYTMYVQFFMLGYMAFLVWLMCMAVRMVRRTG